MATMKSKAPAKKPAPAAPDDSRKVAVLVRKNPYSEGRLFGSAKTRRAPGCPARPALLRAAMLEVHRPGYGSDRLTCVALNLTDDQLRLGLDSNGLSLLPDLMLAVLATLVVEDGEPL